MSVRAHAIEWLVAALAATQAATAVAQDPATEDFAAHVERACNAQRYGLRLAACKRVGKGGEAAVPAVRAHAKAHGANALPVALVEAFVDEGGNGEAVLALLLDWAQDREFFWRAQALRGLSLRAAANLELRNRFQPVFAALVDDPAWLVRVHARHGRSQMPRDFSVEEAQGQWVSRPELDPRAVAKLAALQGDLRALFAALGDERTFLGDGWGKRRAAESFTALKAALGSDHGFRLDADFETNRGAREAIARAIAARDAGAAPSCERRLDVPPPAIGGIEFLSCRNGDLFVCWNADGLVRGGAEPDCRASLQLPPAKWAELLRAATALALPTENGVVVCDRVRFWPRTDRPQIAAAPAALPAPAAEWLKQLAAAIEEAGSTELAASVRDRLTQFEVVAKQSRH